MMNIVTLMNKPISFNGLKMNRKLKLDFKALKKESNNLRIEN